MCVVCVYYVSRLHNNQTHAKQCSPWSQSNFHFSFSTSLYLLVPKPQRDVTIILCKFLLFSTPHVCNANAILSPHVFSSLLCHCWRKQITKLVHEARPDQKGKALLPCSLEIRKEWTRRDEFDVSCSSSHQGFWSRSYRASCPFLALH